MGCFSWLTADTEESIGLEGTSRHQTVFLLRPKGRSPIKEEEYEGYGVFGGVEVYSLLAEMNIPTKIIHGISDDEKRSLGIGLEIGDYYYDKSKNKNWLVFHDYSILRFLLPENEKFEYFKGSYETIIPEYGDTPNNLIRERVWERKKFSEFMKYPLKFSFDEEAVYEELPASKNCPDQGFLYDDEIDSEYD